MKDRGVKMTSIRRRLLNSGYKAYRLRKKPTLTEAIRNKRLQWAKNFQDLTEEDWARAYFTHESTIEMMKNSS